MKTLHGLLIIGLVIAASISTGCKTVTDSAGNSVRIVDTNLVDSGAALVRGVANIGAMEAVKRDRNAESYLRLAAGVIDTALLSKDLSATAVSKSLATIPVKELHGELAAAGVQAALMAYDVFVANHVKGAVNANYVSQTLLAALRDGIYSAIGVPQAGRSIDELWGEVRKLQAQIEAIPKPQYIPSPDGDYGIMPHMPAQAIDWSRLVQVQSVRIAD